MVAAAVGSWTMPAAATIATRVSFRAREVTARS
jgi:hypothetical protein